MNRSRLVPTVAGFVIALVAVATAAIGVAYAQQAGAGPRGGQMAAGGRGMMQGGRLAMMRFGLGQLGLSAEQKQQVRGLLQGRAAEFRSLGVQLRTARRAVNSAIANDETEAAIRAASAELAKVEADMAVLRAGVRKQVFGVLTPEQQARAKALRLKALERALRSAPEVGRVEVGQLPVVSWQSITRVEPTTGHWQLRYYGEGADTVSEPVLPLLHHPPDDQRERRERGAHAAQKQPERVIQDGRRLHPRLHLERLAGQAFRERLLPGEDVAAQQVVGTRVVIRDLARQVRSESDEFRPFPADVPDGLVRRRAQVLTETVQGVHPVEPDRGPGERPRLRQFPNVVHLQADVREPAPLPA